MRGQQHCREARKYSWTLRKWTGFKVPKSSTDRYRCIGDLLQFYSSAEDLTSRYCCLEIDAPGKASPMCRKCSVSKDQIPRSAVPHRADLCAIRSERPLPAASTKTFRRRDIDRAFAANDREVPRCRPSSSGNAAPWTNGRSGEAAARQRHGGWKVALGRPRQCQRA